MGAQIRDREENIFTRTHKINERGGCLAGRPPVGVVEPACLPRFTDAPSRRRFAFPFVHTQNKTL